MEPHSQVITHKSPPALRGDALRAVIEPLGFDDEIASDVVPRAEELPLPLAEVDLGPPPSSDEPRALAGEELSRVLEALRNKFGPT